MKINVKILQGAECNVDVLPADSVEKLKEFVQVDKIDNIICIISHVETILDTVEHHSIQPKTAAQG